MKPEQQKNFLFILIPSTILVIAWIGFGIYNKAVTSTITAQQQISILPIAPTFETGVFAALKNRTVVEPLYTVDKSALVPSPTETPASASAPLVITPSIPATDSAAGGNQ